MFLRPSSAEEPHPTHPWKPLRQRSVQRLDPHQTEGKVPCVPVWRPIPFSVLGQLHTLVSPRACPGDFPCPPSCSSSQTHSQRCQEESIEPQGVQREGPIHARTTQSPAPSAPTLPPPPPPPAVGAPGVKASTLKHLLT